MFINMDGIINLRELGGIRTKEGKRVRKNCLYRCGELHKASEKDVQRLTKEIGLYSLVDFRSPEEAEQRPNVELPGVKTYLIPALPPMVQPKDRMKDHPPEDAEEIFPRIYRELAETETSQHAYRHFFDILLEAAGRPVLWHCRQGKDRTGVAAILLLNALGVSREDCIREYLQTNEYMLPVFEAYCERERELWKQDMMRIISLVYEKWLNNYFQSVDENFGGMERYLEKILKLSKEEQNALRRAYLEE